MSCHLLHHHCNGNLHIRILYCSARYHMSLEEHLCPIMKKMDKKLKSARKSETIYIRRRKGNLDLSH